MRTDLTRNSNEQNGREQKDECYKSVLQKFIHVQYYKKSLNTKQPKATEKTWQQLHFTSSLRLQALSLDTEVSSRTI